MSDPQRVSIAMCTYNAERWVLPQLESFVLQTVLPAELVLQDDGSTDSTMSVVEAFAKRAPFEVRIERNESNQGPTGNFERAMSRCTGDVMVFSDADDVWLPQRIARTLTVLQDRPSVGCVFSDAQLVDADLRPLGMTLWESIRFTEADQRAFVAGDVVDALFRRTIGFGGCMTIRRPVLDLALPIERPWGHDNWTASIATALFDVAIVNEPLMLYRQHASQYSGGRGGSLRDKLKRGGAPRPQRDWIPRGSSYESLARRLAQVKPHAVDAERLKRVIESAREKAEHLTMREQLSSVAIGRVVPVVRDGLRRRYSKYSNGVASAMRDLVFGRY